MQIGLRFFPVIMAFASIAVVKPVANRAFGELKYIWDKKKINLLGKNLANDVRSKSVLTQFLTTFVVMISVSAHMVSSRR